MTRKTVLSTSNLSTKSRAKAIQPIIFTTVTARKVWAYILGIKRLITNIEEIMIKVSPFIKEKITQKCGTSSRPLPVYIRQSGGTANSTTKTIKARMEGLNFNFLLI